MNSKSESRQARLALRVIPRRLRTIVEVGSGRIEMRMKSMQWRRESYVICMKRLRKLHRKSDARERNLKCDPVTALDSDLVLVLNFGPGLDSDSGPVLNFGPGLDSDSGPVLNSAPHLIFNSNSAIDLVRSVGGVFESMSETSSAPVNFHSTSLWRLHDSRQLGLACPLKHKEILDYCHLFGRR
ncbi:hypothetical protein EVAR_47726_1 [Eumeta japonica]|uniref:Uncharacterized protein n=1 Tax=Eumeta variegata TaxID=151549 RepID=A0A4C1VUN3_EUMVA|nr:hypothetical protein EVAR_47726_1 [Eumeta japonica]